ncbi:MAG: NAD-dependent epimerase/dehydratase family protein [Desulfotomaculaceae bacterium]
MRLKGRNVLVTGWAGFLGTHLCQKLVAEGAVVKALDMCAGGENSSPAALPGCDLVQCNVANPDRVMDAATGADTIVHLAFPMVLRQRAVDAQSVADIMAGLINLINAALERNALLIYISSIAVYGNGRYVPIDEDHPLEPVLIHGAVKLAGENLCQVMAVSDGLRLVVLRVADIYGPGNARLSVPIRFLLQAMRNQPITVYGDGLDSRTYTYVSDFTEAVVLSMNSPSAAGGNFNIGGDQCISMLELAEAVREVTGSAGPVSRVERPGSGRKLHISSLKAKKVLGFKPTFGITDGLALTYEWIKDHPDFYQRHD